MDSNNHFDFNKINNILSNMFNIEKNELENIDIYELCYVFTLLILYIDNNVHTKIYDISKLNSTEIEVKKSAFDEFDIEEGYVEEDKKDIWKYYIDSLNNIIKYSIEGCKNSLYDTYSMGIEELLEYINFDIEYRLEHKNDNEEG